MPLPRCSAGIVFSGCLSVHASMRLSVDPVSMISNKPLKPVDEFHQTLVDDVVEVTDELIRL